MVVNRGFYVIARQNRYSRSELGTTLVRCRPQGRAHPTAVFGSVFHAARRVPSSERTEARLTWSCRSVEHRCVERTACELNDARARVRDGQARERRKPPRRLNCPSEQLQRQKAPVDVESTRGCQGPRRAWLSKRGGRGYRSATEGTSPPTNDFRAGGRHPRSGVELPLR